MKFPKFGFKIAILTFILFDILLFGFYITNKNSNKSFPTAQGNPADYPEVHQLAGNNMSFTELKKYFTDLANAKGAEYAYNVLKIAPVPPNTDMHLMGHVVGDVLYKQQGINGIKICTNDFRNACSHSIVVGLLLDKGEKVLPDIAKACRLAPGGSGAYTMCYHGLGHGVLAYTNYDLPKAVNLCQKTETGQGEGVQCIGGTIMEIISGGDHDKLTWGKMRPNYLKASNPLYPCLSSFMPANARSMCITYLTPYLWEAVGANMGQPNSSDFAKAFALCNPLSEPDRDTCFAGFGKEFVVLAQNRDIRIIDQMTNDQLTQVYSWCQMAKQESGIRACNSSALSSLYWGGENKPDASVRFCSVISDKDRQGACFGELIGSVSYYISDTNYRQNFCGSLPQAYKSDCQSRLKT